MLDKTNKIKLENSNVGTINQTNVERQEINIFGNGDLTKIALSHKLFPDYIVDTKLMKDGRYSFISKSTSEEAERKYPHRFKTSFKVLDERYKNIKDPYILLDMLQYADSPVEIEITKFEQYLGDILDPYPDPEMSLEEKKSKSYIMPDKRKLPKFELDIDILFEDSKFKLKNINLKLAKQLSSKTLIFNNYSQKSSAVFLQLVFEYISKDEIKCNFEYKINEETIKSSKTLYIYSTFLINLFTKKYSLYDIKRRTILISGEVKEDKKKEIQNIINFKRKIEMIMEIERYFHIKFDVPYTISKIEFDKIRSLYKLIIENQKRIEISYLNIFIKKKDINIKSLEELVENKPISIENKKENYGK